MAAKSFLRLVTGKIKAIQAIIVSAGAGNDGDLVALDSSGKFDVSVLPAGVGPDVKVITVSEVAGLSAGDYVNIFDSTGPKVRLADNSNGREAHGFVKAAFADAASATVYFEGGNDDLSGLTAGDRVFLGTAGGIITTPLIPVTDVGKISQLLGSAVSATEVNTDIDDCIQL
jgi:hypothetical protein